MSKTSTSQSEYTCDHCGSTALCSNMGPGWWANVFVAHHSYDYCSLDCCISGLQFNRTLIEERMEASREMQAIIDRRMTHDL